MAATFVVSWLVMLLLTSLLQPIHSAENAWRESIFLRVDVGVAPSANLSAAIASNATIAAVRDFLVELERSLGAAVGQSVSLGPNVTVFSASSLPRRSAACAMVRAEASLESIDLAALNATAAVIASVPSPSFVEFRFAGDALPSTDTLSALFETEVSSFAHAITIDRTLLALNTTSWMASVTRRSPGIYEWLSHNVAGSDFLEESCFSCLNGSGISAADQWLCASFVGIVGNASTRATEPPAATLDREKSNAAAIIAVVLIAAAVVAITAIFFWLVVRQRLKSMRATEQQARIAKYREDENTDYWKRVKESTDRILGKPAEAEGGRVGEEVLEMITEPAAAADGGATASNHNGQPQLPAQQQLPSPRVAMVSIDDDGFSVL